MTRTYLLDGLCCPNCAAKIERHAAKLEGVQSAAVDVMAQKLTLTADDKSHLPVLLEKITQIAAQVEPDIKVSPFEESEPAAQNAESETRASALPKIRMAVGAFAIGEYPEGVAVMLFYQVGEAFQAYAVGRSRRSIVALMDIRPDFANLKTGGGVRRVAPDEVRVGERIVVKPGEKIPLDGVVTEGRSALDMSALTGESLPRDVEPGAEVLSGSINKNGLLTVEVTKRFGESTVSKILALVQSASSAKAPVENFITKFARYYTPAVVCAAAALAVVPPLALGGGFADWLHRALVFLVVSCPCALVISIPLSFFGGIGGASRNGILVKGSHYLDALHDVDTVVFDKTGTLTKGVFAVTEVLPANG
ncbi:MAG: heavy metal translocating P-type ATPase, partial [Oscillospiraceae bacterium]|nr:heavy metal translocating P-type ATPase [Oscillospiraceae bacterium]